MNNTYKIEWERTGLSLRATAAWNYSNPGLSAFNEITMDPVQHWCWQTGVGKRMSFDTFQFKTDEEITMFLLRWS